MFDKKVKFIYDFNINQLKKLGPYFTVEKLNEIDIHPAIHTYINAAVDYLIYQDRQALTGNSLFDYSGEDIASYLVSIDEILKSRKKFSLKYYAGLAEEAIRFNVDFIVSPKAETLNIVFGENRTVPSEEIMQRLNHIYYYDYFRKVIVSFLRKKNVVSLNRDEFTELVERVDKISTESNSKDITASFIEAAASFFNIGESGNREIPVEAFLTFVNEKNLTGYAEQLNEAVKDYSADQFEPSFYYKIVGSVPEETTEYIEPGSFTEDIDAGVLHSDEDEENSSGDIIEELTESDEYQLENNDLVFTEGNDENEAETEPEKNEIPDIISIAGQDDSVTGKDEISENNFKFPEPEENNDNEFEFPDFKENDEPLADFEEEDIIELPENDTDDDKPASDEIDEDEEVINFPDDDDDFEFSEIDEDKNEDGIKDELTDNFIGNEEDDDNEPVVEEFDIEEDEQSDDNEEEKIPDITELQDDFDIPEFEEDDPGVGEGYIPEDELEADLQDNLASSSYQASHNIDPAEILEHKKMPKIIQEVFDYDMEEFADTIELIANSENKDQALNIISELFERNGVSPSSKEAQNFKEIILEYYK